jgi:hypothetical protein
MLLMRPTLSASTSALRLAQSFSGAFVCQLKKKKTKKNLKKEEDLKSPYVYVFQASPQVPSSFPTAGIRDTFHSTWAIEKGARANNIARAFLMNKL